MNHLIYILLVISFFEFFSRYGYKIFPYEGFQRYSIHTERKYSIQLKSDKIEFEPFSIKINGRGAIGKIYNGEPIQIAFFGTSSLFYPVPNNKTWPELLRKSRSGIHVDNFGMFNESLETLFKKIDKLCLSKLFYDISVIQLSHLEKNRVHLYHNKFKPKLDKFFQSYQQIRSWYSSRKKWEGEGVDFIKNKPYFFDYKLRTFFIERNLQHTLFKELFIQHEYKINTNLEYEQLILKIINKAHCISDKVFWITEPIPWNENMLDYYYSIPLYMDNVSNSYNYVFLNHESFLKYRLRQKNTVQNILKQREDITFIDSYTFIKKEVVRTPQLFILPTHFSARGHKLMFNKIRPKIMEYINSGI